MKNKRRCSTVKMEDDKSTPRREKLGRVFGAGGFEDTSGKVAKIGGLGMTFVISRVNLELGV